MADRDAFGDSQRGQEQDYFYKRDRELVEKMRAEDEARDALRQLGRITGISDEAVLRELQRHGFNQQTANLLELALLVLVAWSDGTVTPEERTEIMKVAGLRGVEQGSAAQSRLEEWLEARPAEGLFETAWRAIRAASEDLPPAEREISRGALLKECARVAAASGGFLSLGSKISSAEKAVIGQIAGQLGCDEARAREIFREVD